MSANLLNPNASVTALPHAVAHSAPRGLTLGDHVDADDVALQSVSGTATTAASRPAASAASAAPSSLRDPMGRYFSPYENNGGTVVAVSGKGYAVVASDTRLGSDYSIPTRYVSRILKLTDRAVLASSGMQSDIAVLHKILKIRLAQYRYNHHKEMTLSAVAQMLSTILYYRRFQPYYAFNVLGGIDEEGEGWSYSYDAIGSHEKVRTVCSGTGQMLLQPVLDNQVEFRQAAEGAAKPALNVSECVDLVKDGFTSACERDIYTGDMVEICVITDKGVDMETLELRAD